MDRDTRLEVWSVLPREGDCEPRRKLIGRAYRNRDGSINVLLDALPLGAKMHIREAKNLSDSDR